MPRSRSLDSAASSFDSSRATRAANRARTDETSVPTFCPSAIRPRASSSRSSIRWRSWASTRGAKSPVSTPSARTAIRLLTVALQSERFDVDRGLHERADAESEDSRREVDFERTRPDEGALSAVTRRDVEARSALELDPYHGAAAFLPAMEQETELVPP